MRRRFVAAHACLASVAILGLWSSPPVSVVRAAPGTPRVSWSPCYRDLGLPFECGTVQVPLDHDGPAEAAISIALVRLAATGPGARIGSLFFNPGGPGGSGVDFLLGFAPFIPPPLRARFDLIGFDPRGIARSTAVRCFGNPRQWAGFLTPFPFPVTAADEAVWAAADQYLIGACDQRAARIIDHMSTADAARDLDLLREAVGDELLSYVGYSVPARTSGSPTRTCSRIASARWLSTASSTRWRGRRERRVKRRRCPSRRGCGAMPAPRLL